MTSAHSDHRSCEARAKALATEVERLEIALFEAHRRLDEQAKGQTGFPGQSRSLSLEMRDLLRTRTFRWTRLPRRIYAKLRYGNAGRVPPIPD